MKKVNDESIWIVWVVDKENHFLEFIGGYTNEGWATEIGNRMNMQHREKGDDKYVMVDEIPFSEG